MVNKAALSVLGIIVLVSMGVGILIGMQLGGPVGGQGGDNSDGGGPTPIPEEQTRTPVPTASPGSSPNTQAPGTDDSEEENIVPADRFDSDVIRSEMERLINEKRQSRGAGPLGTSGLLAQRVEWMAQNHSIDMAEEGRAIHRIDGRSSSGRYRKWNLYDTCRFQPNDGGDTINADGNKFENIKKVFAGTRYSENGESRLHRNNTAVANAIVTDWFDNQFLDDRLLYRNADVIGVGVTVTDDGEVYATSNVC